MNLSIHGDIDKFFCWALLILIDAILSTILLGYYMDWSWHVVPGVAIFILFVTLIRCFCAIGPLDLDNPKYAKMSPAGSSTFQFVLWVEAISLLPFLLYVIAEKQMAESFKLEMSVNLWYWMFGPIVTGMVIGMMRGLKETS